MNRRLTCSKFALVLLLALLVGTFGCSGQSSGPRAWIDFPNNGANVPVGVPVKVISHAYAREGLANIMLTVNGWPCCGYPVQSGDTFSQATHNWTPQLEGLNVLTISGTTKSGATLPPVSVNVMAIGKQTITPTLTATPTGTVTRVTPASVGAPDLAIVGVEAIYAGIKGDTPFCNTRVRYQNVGTVAVPSNFTIQFHFNGTPQIANTVAGGLPPGGTAEITFVYQFEGSPYIGINLDSTNVIAESNESNNAFAEARMCSVPAGPVTWFTDTPTPTPTRTPTIGIQPPPPVTGCTGNPVISSFSASPSTIDPGDAATLSWGSVSNADSVSIDPGIGGVATPGSLQVRPKTTTTYTLTARCSGTTATRQTTVTVRPATPTFTPTRTRTPTPTRTSTPRDTDGPPAPALVSPKGTFTQCRTSVTLDWNPVSDPSGIKQYVVKWVRDGSTSGGTTTTGTQHTISLTCDNRSHTYTWSVFAEDNAGNRGDTASASFTNPAGLH